MDRYRIYLVFEKNKVVFGFRFLTGLTQIITNPWRKKPMLKNSPYRSTPKQRQTHVQKLKIIKKKTLSTRFPPLGGTPHELGHQSVGQKFTPKKIISGTVEMGQQSVNKLQPHIWTKTAIYRVNKKILERSISKTSDETNQTQIFAFFFDHSVGQWKWDTSQLIGETLTKTARWDAVSWFWALVGVPSNGRNRVRQIILRKKRQTRQSKSDPKPQRIPNLPARREFSG